MSQLGLGDTVARLTPTLITALSARVVVGIATGYQHSIFRGLFFLFHSFLTCAFSSFRFKRGCVWSGSEQCGNWIPLIFLFLTCFDCVGSTGPGRHSEQV